MKAEGSYGSISGSEYVVEFLPKLKIEIAVDSEQVDAVDSEQVDKVVEVYKKNKHYIRS